MTADVFAASHAYNSISASIGELRDKNGLLSSSEAEPVQEAAASPSIHLRNLPSNSEKEDVRNMLTFASQDLVEVEVIPGPKYSEGQGFRSAVAKFRTLESALDAKKLLNGKRNATDEANLIVDLVPDSPPGAIGSRRNTVDSVSIRQGSIHGTNAMSNATNGRQSRYNGTFQNMEKMSPPNGTPGLGNGEFPVQNLFSPTSPVNKTFPHHNRNLGKSVINDELDDDDGLLNESIDYATAGPPVQSLNRRATNPNNSIPVSRFSSLSLNTTSVNGMNSPPMQNYASPRSAATMQSPATVMSAMSPHTIPSAVNSIGSSGYTAYPSFRQPNYPPVNPADQNPPCNTLYVGNLPMDTSEDELKAVFSKQRGYKRLCFRTKQNGPMCFVEFEDISFATKALSDLYGHPLHNSVKGGIRLSFSKNPLGVRNGQSSSMGSPSGLAPSMGGPFGGCNPAFGASNGGPPPGFSTATGPPPGLSAPPGLSTPSHSTESRRYGGFNNHSPFGHPFEAPNNLFEGERNHFMMGR